VSESSIAGSDVPRGVIAIGASAGGVEALKQVAASLSPDLPYAVLVTLHMAAASPSVLAQIVDRSGPLPATQAVDGEHLRPGHVYVATPDRHLLVRDHRVVVSRGPTEDGHRPAINPLLRSAAVAFGPRAVGVLLSGVLDDGVLGLAAIRARGGVTVVQDPDDALFPDMPRNAIAAQVVDHEVSAGAAGRLFKKLSERPDEEFTMPSDPAMELENRIAMGPRYSDTFDAETLGPPSGFTCPDCNGSLMAVGTTNYRCRVGHAWTPEALLRARDRETENALWIALRSLEEKAKLSRRHEGSVSPGALQRRYAQIARETEHAVDVLRARLSELVDDPGGHGDEPAE
jgi:two-component system, chemotaxis family, protein-glutamate methylesterase/glutaminase